MGNGVSSLFSCFKARNQADQTDNPNPEVVFAASEPLDETLGHSFCYLDNIYDDATDTVLTTGVTSGGGVRGSIVNGFESTSSFSALPLQPVPRGGGMDPVMERGGFFLSGPIERGALSGPLDASSAAADSGGVPFSAPLGGMYVKRKKKKGISGIRKALSWEKKRPWVVPVLNFVGRKEGGSGNANAGDSEARNESDNVQWALGKAGEDRVHVVVSEEQGWLFVGIYDGFNGPDAPEFLMDPISGETGTVAVPKKVTFQSEEGIEVRRRRLWEFLAEDDAEDGLDLSGSDRFAFSVDDALRVSNAGSAVSRRWLLLSKLKQGLSKHKEGHGGRLFPWSVRLEEKEKVEVENRVEEKSSRSGRKRKEGPVDHELVLKALSQALELTELAYLDMTDKVIDTNPELALMGSCLLVVLMRDEDVYVMNVGDSRAIVAQYEPQEVGSSMIGSSIEGIAEESSAVGEKAIKASNETPALAQAMRLTALQLSTDHSTSIEEEVIRIKNEHPDDKQCIVIMKSKRSSQGHQSPRWNDALLEMFRNEYIGTAPYISCLPSLRHHRLCPRDQFLVLSSDGLYQYLSNQEVVSQVESFMEKFPDGDPAQHLIEELLFRAAKKAGMDFHELLDIPQGDRRKYHDDVTVMVVSLEGRIWKSSGKYL
ncbi:protein phosphatase 2c 29 [Quercus suber]|uniref:Protein phosphatase 2c 29 n=1 Tax=Quercus suber TaxID=58331 RepID=A0AAW0K4N2_QUESU